MTPKLRRISLWLAPLIAAAVTLLMMHADWAREGALVGGLTVLCALWWIFEPIPIPATAMIPLGVFPLLGILDGKQVAQAYGDPLIILLMGGAMLSKAMEKSGAHRRLALYMVNLFGGDSQRRLVVGFMVASAALSMWVSNTATTLMLLPVAYAVLQSVNSQGSDSQGANSQAAKKLAVPLFLGIAKQQVQFPALPIGCSGDCRLLYYCCPLLRCGLLGIWAPQSYYKFHRPVPGAVRRRGYW
jgi:sodium-dependent dicarboxylate transporter 2/3/5